MPKPIEKIKLSILILSIPSRLSKLEQLLDCLEKQIHYKDEVEILSLVDNKSLHIYEKRNELLSMARGKYICFIDDDDFISTGFVPSIVKVIDSDQNPDVICFKQRCVINGWKFDVIFDIRHQWSPMEKKEWNDTKQGFNDLKRPPFHMCPWKAELAKSEKFLYSYDEHGQSTEDVDWLLRLYPKVEIQTFIDDQLHFYAYDENETESSINEPVKFYTWDVPSNEK